MRPQLYEIRLQGHLDQSYGQWFGLNLEQSFDHDSPITVLSGVLPDQSALHGVLVKIQAMGIPLLELRRREVGSAKP